MPLDIFTDARANSGEALASDRSYSARESREKRVSRYSMIGEAPSNEVQELLRMASSSASRERRMSTPKKSINDEQSASALESYRTDMIQSPGSAANNCFATPQTSTRKVFQKWNSNTDVFASEARGGTFSN